MFDVMQPSQRPEEPNTPKPAHQAFGGVYTIREARNASPGRAQLGLAQSFNRLLTVDLFAVIDSALKSVQAYEDIVWRPSTFDAQEAAEVEQVVATRQPLKASPLTLDG